MEVEIVRPKENVNNFLSYKIFIDDTLAILISNGESKTITLDRMPVKVYAKIWWLKSNEILVDSTTNVLSIKGNPSRNWIFSSLASTITLVLLLPKSIWDNSAFAKDVSYTGLLLILLWLIYVFLIQRNSWLQIEKAKQP